MKKLNLIFDMDGTLVDFYSVDGWLNYLQHEDTTPYDIAVPLIDLKELDNTIKTLQSKKYNITVSIVTWTAKNTSKEYHKKNNTK